MAAKEGFRRLHLLGNAILGLGLLLIAGALTGWILAVFLHTPPLMLGLVPFGVFLSADGASILLITWIVEGFLEPRQPPRE